MAARQPGPTTGEEAQRVMLLSNVEYVALRMLRRFLFSSDFLEKYARFLPYYRANVGRVAPESIVDAYVRHLDTVGVAINGAVVVELGVGATNGTLYELAARGARRAYGVEPYVALEPEADAAARRAVRTRHGEAELSSNIARFRSVAEIPAASADLILSTSVLEHVRDIDALIDGCAEAIRPNGVMLHLVDYRDHFFKYPFHFLQFSENVWTRYLDPGDLPRWRLSDQVRAFERKGWRIAVLDRTDDPEGLAKLGGRIDERFDANDPFLSTTQAVLLCHRALGG